MTAPSPIYAYDFAPDGAATPCADIDAASAPDVAYRWVHFDLAEPGVTDWIAAQTDALVADALTRQDTRPRAAMEEDGLILILRGVNLNPDADPEDMVSLRLWVSERLVISTRIRKLMAVTSLAETMAAGRGPGSPGALVAALAAGLTQRMAPVMTGLADQAADLEERSVDRHAGLRGELAGLRRTVIALRRYVAPQREALARLYQEAHPLFDADARSSLRETADQITRLVEELDAVRDRSAILNDQLADARAEEMNRAMLLLSVVAAIFLPLGFVTGLLGINVGGLPGASWPFAFTVVCLICAALAGGLALMFRRKGWL
ncbi:MAG: zinc transporter ZntB [Alphaproteobacteria bacterium]|nr:zinc transporter ZntB [Alphaproteobacteria bacterium]